MFFWPKKKKKWLKGSFFFFFFSAEVVLVLQALKHSILLEDIRMCSFWEGKAARDLEGEKKKKHRAEEESQEDVGSAGG